MSRVFGEPRLSRTQFVDNTAFSNTENYIHCPVCKTSYSSEQTQAHIMKHLSASAQLREQKKQTRTQASSRNLLAYPMIEPLEFKVEKLAPRPQKQTVKVEKQEKNKKPSKVIQMVDRETQTINRPLLQEQNDERDLYNCFDHFFNGGSISYSEVVGKNVGLASKRQLTEWEEARLIK